MNFLEKISNRFLRTNSHLCIGLDPDTQKIPEHLSKEKKKALKKEIEKRIAWEKFNRNREYFGIAWSLINTRQFSFVQ